MDLLTIIQKLVKKVSQYLEQWHRCSLRSCSFESFSDAIETGGYKECSDGFWDSDQQEVS